MYRRSGGTVIRANDTDREMHLERKTRMESSQKPSMWEYNPKGGMPTELANLETSTFLTSPLGEILCFLPRDILARLCSMLSPCDFLHLSLTCRFLHWRMFTFCTCYTSCTVEMTISDELLSKKSGTEANWKYILCNGIIYDDDDTWLQLQFPFNINCFEGENGDRGLFISQPFCIRKPFYFDTLNLSISLPFFCKQFYDKCLPYILAVRNFTRHLDIYLHRLYYISTTDSINFPDTNDFLMTINASYYDYIEMLDVNRLYIRNNVEMYINCPYARQMYRVYVASCANFGKLNIPVFENNIGSYDEVRSKTIKATLKNFLTGSTNLVYHEYHIRKINNRFPLIEYLFRHYDKFEEYLYTHYELPICNYYFHIWAKVVKAKNGELFRIVIQKGNCGGRSSRATLKIGKDETFDEMDKKYGKRYCERTKWMKMETAVEPDEAEKSDVTR